MSPGETASEVERELSALRRRSAFATAARIVSYIAYAWVITSLLILTFGFFLLLFAANPDAEFSQWVYRQLARAMQPFRGIFPEVSTSSGSTLDVSILFAMLVYGLAGLGVHMLIEWVTYRREGIEQRISRNQLRLERARERARHSEQAAYPPPQQPGYPPAGSAPPPGPARAPGQQPPTFGA